jgi:hypothetical protein
MPERREEKHKEQSRKPESGSRSESDSSQLWRRVNHWTTMSNEEATDAVCHMLHVIAIEQCRMLYVTALEECRMLNVTALELSDAERHCSRRVPYAVSHFSRRVSDAERHCSRRVPYAVRHCYISAVCCMSLFQTSRMLNVSALEECRMLNVTTLEECRMLYVTAII